jgi:hypothetical protein
MARTQTAKIPADAQDRVAASRASQDQALAAVWAARYEIERAHSKRDAALAAAATATHDAEVALGAALSALIDATNLDTAADWLKMSKAEIRRASNTPAVHLPGRGQQ